MTQLRLDYLFHAKACLLYSKGSNNLVHFPELKCEEIFFISVTILLQRVYNIKCCLCFIMRTAPIFYSVFLQDKTKRVKNGQTNKSVLNSLICTYIHMFFLSDGESFTHSLTTVKQPEEGLGSHCFCYGEESRLNVQRRALKNNTYRARLGLLQQSG